MLQHAFSKVQTVLLCYQHHDSCRSIQPNLITYLGRKATVLSTVSAACETCQIHLFLWACPVEQAERGPERWQRQACSRKNKQSAADDVPSMRTMSSAQPI